MGGHQALPPLRPLPGSPFLKPDFQDSGGAPQDGFGATEVESGSWKTLRGAGAPPHRPPGSAAWFEATEERGRSLPTPFSGFPSVGLPQATVRNPYFRISLGGLSRETQGDSGGERVGPWALSGHPVASRTLGNKGAWGWDLSGLGGSPGSGSWERPRVEDTPSRQPRHLRPSPTEPFTRTVPVAWQPLAGL